MSSSLSPTAAWPRAIRLAVGRRWVTVGAFALVAGTGFAKGGYFPESWGWPTLGAAWAAALAVLARERIALTRTAATAAALLAALTGWTALSVVWSIDVTQSVLEAERTAVYAAALLAALLWAGRRPERLVHGAWAAISVLCGWALLTRLVPDRFGVVDAISGYRLSEPIGYWNALGLLAGIGALLALGLAARAQSLAGRAFAGASLPPLLATLYFTFSRGAWLALAFGLLATFLLDRRRLQLGVVLLVVAPWTALALLRASTSPALTTRGAQLPAMAAQGHRLLLELAGLALVSALAAAAATPLESKLVLPARLRPHAALALLLAAALAAAILVARFGSPLTLARHGWHSFASSPPASGPNLNSRLFHLSGRGRTTQWRVAWHQAEAYPWLGSGAGTYEVYWNLHRPVAGRVQNVHNLYLETLADLGPFGLLLLATALALPLAGAVRSRGRPLAAAACGGYVAYLLHAAVDWDWEIASVTLAFLLCGAMLLSAPRRRGRLQRPSGRGVALAAALLLGATGVYTIATRIPLERLAAAARSGHWAAAERDTRRASALAPWSSEPWLALGEAALGAGRVGEARAAFRKAVAKSPTEWTAWYDLARASSGRERAHALARATRLNPLSPEVAAVRRRS
jgi:O-antigen ligase